MNRFDDFTDVVLRRVPAMWRPLAIACSGATIVLAVGDLIGWATGSVLLTSWIPNVVPMKITGAIALAVIGTALLTLSVREKLDVVVLRSLHLAAVTSLAAGIYGLSTSLLARLNEGSLVLPRDVARQMADDPFVIPLASAVSFLLMAAAMTSLERDMKTGGLLSSVLALLSGANAMFTLIAYALGVEVFYTESSYVMMPLSVAILFLLVSVATVVVQPHKGIFSAILADTTSARGARRILPWAIFIPFLLGLAHEWLSRRADVDHAFAQSAQTLLIMVLLSMAVFVTAIELGKRERVELRLRGQRDQEAENRQLLWELSQDMLAVANREGYFIEINPAWTATLGWSREELKSRSFLELVHPEDREATVNNRREVFDGEGAPYFRNRYLCKDGTYRTLQWRSVLNPDTREVFAVARDVTEMADAEEKMRDLNRELEMRVKLRTRELETANRELESFSYAVSHDLRAPLRAIEGFSRMVVERFADDLPDQGRHYLSRVRAGSTRMAEIIDGLLTLSRLSRGDLRMEEVDLSTLAKEIVEDLRAAEPERKVEISIEEGLSVIGDRRLLQSLLLNLISNAWKFSAKADSPRVEIGVRRNGVTEFFVRDNGAGFDPKHAGKLFTPFQRLHTVEEFDGTGLGLATVRRVANRHGGFVRAEGKVGEGATFWFSIPSSEAERLAHSINLAHTSADKRQETNNDQQEQRQ